MSASYYRQKPASLGDKLMASLKAAPADTVLFASLAVTAEQLDKIDRTMFQRVNSDMPAADYLILLVKKGVAVHLAAPQPAGSAS